MEGGQVALVYNCNLLLHFRRRGQQWNHEICWASQTASYLLFTLTWKKIKRQILAHLAIQTAQIAQMFDSCFLLAFKFASLAQYFIRANPFFLFSAVNFYGPPFHLRSLSLFLSPAEFFTRNFATGICLLLVPFNLLWTKGPLFWGERSIWWGWFFGCLFGRAKIGVKLISKLLSSSCNCSLIYAQIKAWQLRDAEDGEEGEVRRKFWGEKWYSFFHPMHLWPLVEYDFLLRSFRVWASPGPVWSKLFLGEGKVSHEVIF